VIHFLYGSCPEIDALMDEWQVRAHRLALYAIACGTLLVVALGFMAYIYLSTGAAWTS
jgi:hypothetical protein